LSKPYATISMQRRFARALNSKAFPVSMREGVPRVGPPRETEFRFSAGSFRF
jgi:hypothetical protein